MINNLPHFHPFQKVKIRKIFSSETEMDFGDWGRLDPVVLLPRSTNPETLENLGLSDNHVKNSYLGKIFTVSKAIDAWKSEDHRNPFSWYENSPCYCYL